MSLEESIKRAMGCGEEWGPEFQPVFEDIDCAADWMRHIITALHETGDVEVLADCVEEVASYLGIDMPDRPLKIRKL